MAESSHLSEHSLAIIRSSTFVQDIEWSLRKALSRRKFAVQGVSEKALQNHAANFCRQHLEKFFPEIYVTGVPEVDCVTEQVFCMYKAIRTRLLSEARSKSRIADFYVSESSGAPRVIEPNKCSLHLLQKASTSDVSKLQRRRRPKKHGKTSTSGLPATSLLPGVVDAVSRPDSAELTAQESTNEAMRHVNPNDIHQSSASLDLAVKLTDNMSSQGQAKELAVVAQHTKRTQEESALLTDEVQALQSEVRLLNDHRIFVEKTLRTCQDTYRAEAQSAKNVGIHIRAAQCEAIALVLEDLQTDLDFRYFHEYTKLYGHAPPSSYWLDGLRMTQQQHRIL